MAWPLAASNPRASGPSVDDGAAVPSGPVAQFGDVRVGAGLKVLNHRSEALKARVALIAVAIPVDVILHVFAGRPIEDEVGYRLTIGRADIGRSQAAVPVADIVDANPDRTRGAAGCRAERDGVVAARAEEIVSPQLGIAALIDSGAAGQLILADAGQAVAELSVLDQRRVNLGIGSAAGRVEL
jgi:hypothetical protein